MDKIEKLSGLIAAPVTIFKANGEIDFNAIDKQVESLVNQGVVGAYVSGSTGEGVSCTVEERLAVMDRWHLASKGRLKLIIHIGALAFGDVERLGHHANELGVFATSVVPANYYKPADVASLVEYCRLAAATAPDCRFYYYHSSLSGINLPLVDFLEQADGIIPNLAGIKYNGMNLYEYQNCMHACGGKYDIVYGTDEFFAGALALGAKAFIGSTYNYAAKVYLAIWKAFREGRQADVEKGMRKVCQIVDVLVKHGVFATTKTAMAVQGIDGGDVRPPLRRQTPAEKAEIIAEMKRILA